MVSEHERLEAFRRDVAASTDPQWVREQLGHPHQYSRTFCLCMAIIGALAFSAAFIAIGSI